jgi:hypothetical protein
LFLEILEAGSEVGVGGGGCGPVHINVAAFSDDVGSVVGVELTFGLVPLGLVLNVARALGCAEVLVDIWVHQTVEVLKLGRQLVSHIWSLSTGQSAITEWLDGFLGSVWSSSDNYAKDEHQNPGDGQNDTESDSVALRLAAGEEEAKETGYEGNYACTEENSERDVFEVFNLHVGVVSLKGLDVEEGVTNSEANSQSSDHDTNNQDQGGEDSKGKCGLLSGLKTAAHL